MAVILKRQKEKAFPLYYPDGKLVGYVRDWITFLHIRVQIKEQGLKGYYFMVYGEKVKIDSDGIIDEWKKGFFDASDDLLMKLL